MNFMVRDLLPLQEMEKISLGNGRVIGKAERKGVGHFLLSASLCSGKVLISLLEGFPRPGKLAAVLFYASRIQESSLQCCLRVSCFQERPPQYCL